MNNKLDIILEKLKAGDEKFYRGIFLEYYPPLTYYANKMINDLDVAKEIVQEVFVRIYEKRYALHIDTSFKSYLYKAVYNSCLNHINHINIRDHHHQIIRDDLTEFSSVVDDEMNRNELEHRIYSEIEKLPGQCRKIFKMNRFDGLSNHEIAEQLHLSKRTVETQISKAMKTLRKKLVNYL